MKRYFFKPLIIAILGISGFVLSCKDDEEPAPPSISISETEVTASWGEEVSVDITAAAPAGFGSLTVTKLWDGTEQDTETFDVLPASYEYTVTNEDADHIVTLNFKITDKKGRTDETELVINIELTARQLLLKYNWRLSAEIWKKTGADEISDVYNDDVYRFNADGTYNKSIGAKVDDFSDIWFKYCYYDLNDNTLKLLMSKTGAFGEEVTDTLKITVIDDTKLYADVTYYGLDIFDPKYGASEAFEKRFVAVAKTSSFDPYQNGSEDDVEGPSTTPCAEVVFEND